MTIEEFVNKYNVRREGDKVGTDAHNVPKREQAAFRDYIIANKPAILDYFKAREEARARKAEEEAAKRAEIDASMEHYIVIEDATRYGISIHTARRLTADEKKRFADWAKDRMFCGLGESAKMEGLTWADMPKRQVDGMFPGCDNRVWIITEDEKAALVKLNKERVKEAARRKRDAEIAGIESELKLARTQRNFPSREEARRREKAWNDLHNEGGDGYVPHVYSRDEYEYLTKRLAELKARA